MGPRCLLPEARENTQPVVVAAPAKFDDLPLTDLPLSQTCKLISFRCSQHVLMARWQLQMRAAPVPAPPPPPALPAGQSPRDASSSDTAGATAVGVHNANMRPSPFAHRFEDLDEHCLSIIAGYFRAYNVVDLQRFASTSRQTATAARPLFDTGALVLLARLAYRGHQMAFLPGGRLSSFAGMSGPRISAKRIMAPYDELLNRARDFVSLQVAITSAQRFEVQRHRIFLRRLQLLRERGLDDQLLIKAVILCDVADQLRRDGLVARRVAARMRAPSRRAAAFTAARMRVHSDLRTHGLDYCLCLGLPVRSVGRPAQRSLHDEVLAHWRDADVILPEHRGLGRCPCCVVTIPQGFYEQG